MKASIPVSILNFLKDLKKNNNREWFTEHKERYLTEHENMIIFSEALLKALQKTDRIETPSGKKSLFRIYRDTRFSHDKTPYKTSVGGGFKRATKLLRGGYYFHIEPGNSYVAGGFFGPNTEDMMRIRIDIDHHYEEWRKILKQKKFLQTFEKLEGECLKTAPKGYTNDHPAIDLLRHKQFILKRSFTDKEVLDSTFLDTVILSYQNMRPFFDYMSQVLTSDSNGVPLV
ncbi:MAG TPA: DUF2461 domain-containing protein [Cytophagaceae bacterium]|jgi:uncharacterized protein (TIGR02453 family)|nr:DUF2461 domain-containing protein [Cytophagaceae bacterium]